MKNTMEAQLQDLTFNQTSDNEYRLEFESCKGGRSVDMIAVFTNDDEWTGYIRTRFAHGEWLEDWDGEQPIEKWLERMENSYWDV